jgi:hypothetical protein
MAMLNNIGSKLVSFEWTILELSIKSSKTEHIYPQFCISLVALIR